MFLGRSATTWAVVSFLLAVYCFAAYRSLRDLRRDTGRHAVDTYVLLWRWGDFEGAQRVWDRWWFQHKRFRKAEVVCFCLAGGFVGLGVGFLALALV